jgi:tripartite-type tricarboxylate transporter receptor subunit TctC
MRHLHGAPSREATAGAHASCRQKKAVEARSTPGKRFSHRLSCSSSAVSVSLRQAFALRPLSARVYVVLAAACSILLLSSSGMCAEPYPSRPIRFVVGYAAGGTADVVARAVVAQLQRQMPTSLVIDNRPGAGGIIGYDLVAKAEPDGYTLLCISSSFVTGVAVYPKLPFDPQKDFLPIVLFASGVPNLLVVNPSFPAHSIRELLALAKSRDKPLTYGSPGIGSVQHFVAELFKMHSGVYLQHVPYKGQAPALTALVSGEINMAFLQPPGGVDLIKSGKLRALGFAGATRWSAMSDVPTIAESGVPDFQLKGPFQGMLAPARTGKEVVTTIHNEVRKALASPQLGDFFAAAGWESDGRGAAEFREFLDGEIRRYKEIARVGKIRAE